MDFGFLDHGFVQSCVTAQMTGTVKLIAYFLK